MNRFYSTAKSALIALLLIAALSACGNANQQENSGASGATPAPDHTETEQPATKVYKAVNGEVEIPAQPQNIVVVSRAYLGHLLALGIHPTGAPKDALENPFLEGMIDGIEDLGAGEISSEKVAQLEPDLIITASVDEKSYEQYKKIAPTVQIPWGVYDFRDTLKELGVITGKEQEAEAWLTEYDRKAEQNKAKLAAAIGADETIAIMEITPKAFYVYGDNYGRGGEVVYASFGFKAPDKIQKEVIEGEGWGAVSLETLPEFAADHIILSVLEGADGEADTIMGSKLWQNLPAVKEGQVYKIDAKSFYNSDPISLEKEMDILVEMMLAGQS